MNLAKTTIDRISFIYNLFLIILAVVICILIKIISNGFYNDYIKIINLREMNFAYFSSLFFIINMVKLPNSNELYDELNNEYKKKLKGYNISFGGDILMYGKTHSEETRKLLRQKIPKSKDYYRSINQYDLDGNFIKTWKDSSEIYDDISCPFFITEF